MSPGSLTPDREHFGVFYIKQSYAEEVFDIDGAANQVIGVLSPDRRDSPDEVLREAEYLLDDYGVFSTTPRKDQPSNRFLSDEIRGLGVFANVMPAIFLAVAAMVLNMVMVRLMDQQRTVVGTLKASATLTPKCFGTFSNSAASSGYAAACSAYRWATAWPHSSPRYCGVFLSFQI